MKRGSSAVLALAFVIAASCGGSATPSGTTPTASGAAASARAASSAASATSPSFAQILSSAKVSEYKVTYKLSATGAAGLSGEQSWYFKPPKARFDFSTTASGQTATVSLYALPDGTFMCFAGAGQPAQCLGMSGLDAALQQNPAAALQESLVRHPDQFSGVLVETRQIAGQQAHCYDVKSSLASAPLADGRFCYSAQGIPLLQRFGTQGGTWSMEATNLSTSVPDSDFALPATPTVIGKP